jgi:hypothetical protein
MSDGRGRDLLGRRCTRKRAREGKEIRVLRARRLRLVARDFQRAPRMDFVSDVDGELHHACRAARFVDERLVDEVVPPFIGV